MNTEFDARILATFREVALCGSFTVAGQNIGLTQSAVTRQIKNLEEQLGVRLFERTTRSVELTEAGNFLLERSATMIAEWSQSIARLKEKFAHGTHKIRLGVSDTIGFSSFPGFFSQYRKQNPSDKIELVTAEGDDLIDQLTRYAVDIIVCASRSRWPSGLEEVDTFDDPFIGITPPNSSEEDFFRQPLLTLSGESLTRQKIHDWLSTRASDCEIAMEVAGFDLMVNLVSLGFGNAIVPTRTLAIYGKRKPVQRVPIPGSFCRELSIVLRRDRDRPAYLQSFADSMLFGRF